MIIFCRYGEFRIVSAEDLISKSLRDYGEWAQLEIDDLAAFIQKGDVVVDAGAYIGTHARAFSELVGAEGKVYAFEPNPAALEILTDNCSRARLRNIVVYAQALGNKNGTAAFLSNSLENCGSSRLAGPADPSREFIEIRQLDYFDFEKVSLIKADIEGAEIDLLLGAAQLIARCRPLVFLEANSVENASEIIWWSRKEQYLPYGLIRSAFNPHNFNASSQNFFGAAKECGILLVPMEKFERYRADIEKLNLPYLDTLDGLALLLLHKPQYPGEVLCNSDVAAKLGLAYPAPALEQAAREHEANLAVLNREIAALHRSAVEHDQEIAEKNVQIAALHRSAAEHDQEIVEKNVQIAALHRSAAEHDQEIVEKNVQIAALHRSTVELNRRIADREAQIAALYRSTSWRSTRPLRATRRLVDVLATSLHWRFVRNAGGSFYRGMRRHGVMGLARRMPHYLRNHRRYMAYLVSRPPPSDADVFRTAAPVIRDIRLHPDLAATIEPIDADVSIVIPTLNAGDEFGFLLRKLRAQRGLRNVEIVIVDSGSRDGTVETARAAGCTVVEIRPQDFSHSHARNTGADAAGGEYLLFMVQDAYPIGDYWAYGMLRYLLDHADDRLVAVSCSEYSRSDSDMMYDSMINTHSRFLGCLDFDRIGEHKGDDHMSLRSLGQLSDVSCLIPHPMFDAYRYRGDYAEDLDLGIRLIKDGHRVGMLASIKVVHSHNRPAYYYLKRSFVDVVFLVGMFTDFVYPPVESAAGLIAGIASTAAHLSDWLVKFDKDGATLVLHEELGLWIDEWRRSLGELRLSGRSRLGDHEFDLYIDSLSQRFLPSGELTRPARQEAGRFVDLFLGRLDHFNGFIREIYCDQDSLLRSQLCEAVCKAFAAAAGSALGFLYLDRVQTKGAEREMAETIWKELKKGI